ncbi:MAG: CBS domain-containing protein, partial [Bacteroidota bacterium]
DVRRGLLANINDLNKIPVNSIINRHPAYISENDTITNILTQIKKLSFPIQFIPVVDVNNKLTGLLRFNNLIKGES